MACVRAASLVFRFGHGRAYPLDRDVGPDEWVVIRVFWGVERTEDGGGNVEIPRLGEIDGQAPRRECDGQIRPYVRRVVEAFGVDLHGAVQVAKRRSDPCQAPPGNVVDHFVGGDRRHRDCVSRCGRARSGWVVLRA